MNAYLGTVMSFGFDFPPKGWTNCNGQLLSISTNQALFSLLGTAFGGDGRVTFGLPNLQGRTIIGRGKDTTGATWVVGQAAGTAQTTLTAANLPSHTHTSNTSIKLPAYSDGGNSNNPSGNSFAVSTGASVYSNVAANAALKPFTENLVVAVAGGSQPFNNMSPYQVINYSIALTGLFPSRN